MSEYNGDPAPFDHEVANRGLENYLRSIETLGFKKIASVPFTSRLGTSEKLFIYFHFGHAILLTFETWVEKQINGGGRLYFNWLEHGHTPSKLEFFLCNPIFTRKSISQRCATRLDLSGRPLAELLEEMTSAGTFLSPWLYTPPLIFTHHGDFQPGGALDFNDKSGERMSVRHVKHIGERLRLIPGDVRSVITEKVEA